MRGVTVEPLAADDAAWAEFAARSPAATFFHRPEWAQVIRRCYGYRSHCLGARENGRLTGLVPLILAPTPFPGRALIATAFTVGGGIAAESEAARAALASAAADLGERLGVRYVELRSETAEIADWPVKEGIYADFRREMAADADARLKQIPRKKRADVRKAIDAAPPVDAAADIGAFHRLYVESARNLGTPVHGVKWFRLLAEAFGRDAETSVVKGPDGPVAGLMSFYFRDQVLPYYGGAKPEARRLRAYDYIYWTQMERAVARGAQVFDFGRSKTGTGAFDYKTYWGFSPTPLAYQYRLVRDQETPDVNPNNPKFARFAKIWRRMPLPAARLAGPYLARRLA